MQPDIRNHWLIVLAAALAVFMATIDASIVTVALPAIGSDFAASAGGTEWIMLGYLLPMAALSLPAGRWLDSVGRRPAAVLAIAGFAAASAGAAVSPTLGVLTAARVTQGAFGAMIAAQVPALVIRAVQPSARGRALSIIGALGPLGAASGPTAGGILIETLGWRAIFLVNIPISVIVAVLLLRHLPPAAEPLHRPSRAQLTDAALLVGACGAVLAGLTMATSHTIAWLALLLPPFPLLAAWLRRPDGSAVSAIATTPGIRASLSGLVLLSTAGSSVQYLMPFLLIRFLHASAVDTGLTVLAYPLTMGLTAPVGGLLADRWNARRTAMAGAGLVILADLLLVQASAAARPADLSWRLALVGIGMGLFSGPNQTTIMNLAPRHALATAGAATALLRSLGFALGPALCTLLWAAGSYSAIGLRMALLLPLASAATAGIMLGTAKLHDRGRDHHNRAGQSSPNAPARSVVPTE